MPIYITYLDEVNMVAMTDSGDMLPIEDFTDKYGSPCYPEDARIANIQLPNGRYLKYVIKKGE